MIKMRAIPITYLANQGENPFISHGELERKIDLNSSDWGLYSQEGYALNPEAQRRAAEELVNILGITGKVLDVGSGQNIYVSEALANLGLDVYTLDFVRGQSSFTEENPPRANESVENPSVYLGDIVDISHRKSQLRKHNFDAVIYWGSWSASGGKNSSIERTGRWKSIRDKSSDEDEYAEGEKERALEESVKHLSENGQLIVVSSRYSCYGAGYYIDALPKEREEYAKIINKLNDLGAREIILGGLGREDTEQYLRNLMHSFYIQFKRDYISFNTKRNGYLLDESKVGSFHIPKEHELHLRKKASMHITQLAKELNEPGELNLNMGRIDFIAARF